MSPQTLSSFTSKFEDATLWLMNLVRFPQYMASRTTVLVVRKRKHVGRVIRPSTATRLRQRQHLPGVLADESTFRDLLTRKDTQLVRRRRTKQQSRSKPLLQLHVTAASGAHSGATA